MEKKQREKTSRCKSLCYKNEWRLARFTGGTVCRTSNDSSGLPIGPVNSTRMRIGQAWPRVRTADENSASATSGPSKDSQKCCIKQEIILSMSLIGLQRETQEKRSAGRVSLTAAWRFSRHVLLKGGRPNHTAFTFSLFSFLWLPEKNELARYTKYDRLKEHGVWFLFKKQTNAGRAKTVFC